MSDWFEVAKDIMLPAGLGREVMPTETRSDGENKSYPRSAKWATSEITGVASPAGKLQPLPEPSHVPFVDRIHYFLDQRESELAGEAEYTGDYETGLARERGY